MPPRAVRLQRCSAISVPCSSTKGATGHTLGAAGGLEAIIGALALQQGFLPGGVNTRRVDPDIPIQYLTANREGAPRRVLSNSFGFGGTNCSLILGRAQMKLTAYLDGIGLIGPGLDNWPAARPILAGAMPL